MAFFNGKSLKTKNGIVAAEEALSDKDVIAVYFSAHWCPPCRMFTPMLKAHYEEIVKTGGKIAIIFVSSDNSETEMDKYYNDEHGDWFAVPFSDNETVAALEKNCDVSGIPKFVIINKDGKPLNANARNDVSGKEPEECYEAWKAISNK